MDVETLKDMSTTYWAFPTKSLLESSTYMSKFKGRMLSSEDSEVLERFNTLGEKCEEKVRVYDVSRVTDRIKALSRGIRKTPTLINQGKKYEGAKEIGQWFLSKNL